MADGPVAIRKSATVRSIGLVRSADLPAKVEDVVFPSECRAICSKCYSLRRGRNLNKALLLLAALLATTAEMAEALTIVPGLKQHLPNGRAALTRRAFSLRGLVAAIV